MKRRSGPTRLNKAPKSTDEPTHAGCDGGQATSIWRAIFQELRAKRYPNVRPRDAATLLVLDTSGAEPKLLMGQRHHGLKFLPGKFVSPAAASSLGITWPASAAGCPARSARSCSSSERQAASAARLRHGTCRPSRNAGGDGHRHRQRSANWHPRQLSGFRGICVAGAGDHAAGRPGASIRASSSCPPTASPSTPPSSMANSLQSNGLLSLTRGRICRP